MGIPQPVVDRIYRPQNEGVTGHDGEEQSERASNVLPFTYHPTGPAPLAETPPERGRPGWLEEWPDESVPAVFR